MVKKLTEKQIWKKLITLAKKNVLSGNGGPFSAMIIKDGKIVATGTNSVTSINDPTAHAEVLAIRRACFVLGTFQLDDCIIYSSCEPCPMCLGACYWVRVKEIHYCSSREDAASIGFDDSFIYDEMKKHHKERYIKTIYHPIPERLKPCKVWSNYNKKVVY
jgi:guanine deaminase